MCTLYGIEGFLFFFLLNSLTGYDSKLSETHRGPKWQDLKHSSLLNLTKFFLNQKLCPFYQLLYHFTCRYNILEEAYTFSCIHGHALNVTRCRLVWYSTCETTNFFFLLDRNNKSNIRYGVNIGALTGIKSFYLASAGHEINDKLIFMVNVPKQEKIDRNNLISIIQRENKRLNT